MYFNAKEGRYPVVKLDNHYALFTMSKIDPTEIPVELHRYELGASPSPTGAPVYAMESVPDRCLGTILTREALPLDSNGEFHPETHAVLSHNGHFPTVSEFHDTSTETLDQDPAPGFLYQSSFGLIPVYPHLDMYCSTNNLYVGLNFYDEEDQYMDHFGDVTVNLDALPYLYSTIDTNNNGGKILDFLERNQFGMRTEYQIPSGFCQFPVFRFQEACIRNIDPVLFAEYQKAHGRLLDHKIQNATDRASNTNHTSNKETPER